MKIIIIVILVFVSFGLYSQDNKEKVFVTSQDFVNNHPLIFNVIYFNFSHNYIIAKTDTSKTKISVSNIWGYQEKGVNPYRIFKKHFYRILQADDIYIYCNYKYAILYSRVKEYFFSTGPDSEIFLLTKQNLKTVFSETNPEFIHLIESEFKWYEDFSKYNDKTDTYKLVELYKKSKKLDK